MNRNKKKNKLGNTKIGKVDILLLQNDTLKLSLVWSALDDYCATSKPIIIIFPIGITSEHVTKNRVF